MNFVFEDKLELLNFTNCPDVNRSGVRRFAPSPLADHATSTAISRRFNSDTFFGPKNYIIATGVNHHPHDWAGGTFGDTSRASVFSFLNNKQLKDLQKGRAMLMLDQSLEGHQTHWLWEWFHKECEDYKVSPNAVIYVTGNQLALEQYNPWDKGQISQAKLTKFYRAQGFQPTVKGAKNMIWAPTIAETFNQPYPMKWEKAEYGDYDGL